VAQLRQFKAEIEAHNTRVTLIAFATTDLAQAWIAETQTSFKFLLDPERKAYQEYGIDYSLGRSWSPKVWLEYARLMAKGRKWRGILGDSGQLGGDFIVDRNGVLQLTYPSRDPTDRPTIKYLLEILDDINDDHQGEIKTLVQD
jgi:hypothetical protein